MSDYEGKFVYVFARADGSGDVKIGFSQDPDTRKVQVCVGRGWIVAATFTHHRAHLVEIEAHRILEEFETDSEWFAVPKYIAFDAISQAMHKVDQTSNWVPERPDPPPPPVIPIDVSLKGKHKLPPLLPTSEAYLMGYVRTTDKVRPALQYQWLKASGVPENRIYVERVIGAQPEMDNMLRECRAGDEVAIWSPDIFGSAALSGQILTELAAKNVKVSYAMKETAHD